MLLLMHPRMPLANRAPLSHPKSHWTRIRAWRVWTSRGRRCLECVWAQRRCSASICGSRLLPWADSRINPCMGCSALSLSASTHPWPAFVLSAAWGQVGGGCTLFVVWKRSSGWFAPLRQPDPGLGAFALDQLSISGVF